MLKLLIDTCVWLDLAKDYDRRDILLSLESLIEGQHVELILPSIIVEEFDRHKEKIINQTSDSLSSVLKRVKAAVARVGDPKHREAVLLGLNDVDHRLPTIGDAAEKTVARVEDLFARSKKIEATEQIILAAATRGIKKTAPFHNQRNGIADSIIFEIFLATVAIEKNPNTIFAFVTHNTKDFSDPKGDKRHPHPDISENFDRDISCYYVDLADAIISLNDDALIDLLPDEFDYVESEPRRFAEILGEIEILTNQVWYNRHQITREKIENGIIKIVDEETFPIEDHHTRPIQKNIWQGALQAAQEVEEKHGVENLGPWDDFEWGMINGKLSALRWILGEEWDMLDT